MFRGIVSHHDAGHSGSGQRIVETLNRCQRHAEGRRLRRKQPAAGITLHDGNANLLLLADPVQLCPLRRNTAQFLFVPLLKIILYVLAGGKHIKRRIDAEENHLDLTAQRSHLRHRRIMGAHTDMPDNPLLL